MLEQIAFANDRFEEDLDRARNMLLATRQDSAGVPVSRTGLLDEYEKLLEAHEEVLANHRRLSTNLTGSNNHRQVKRTLGAVLAEQRDIRYRYTELLRNTGAIPDSAVGTEINELSEARYVVEPPYYLIPGRVERPQLRESISAMDTTRRPSLPVDTTTSRRDSL